MGGTGTGNYNPGDRMRLVRIICPVVRAGTTFLRLICVRGKQWAAGLVAGLDCVPDKNRWLC